LAPRAAATESGFGLKPFPDEASSNALRQIVGKKMEPEIRRILNCLCAQSIFILSMNRIRRGETAMISPKMRVQTCTQIKSGDGNRCAGRNYGERIKVFASIFY
jgi:hypothetical protein